VNARAVERLAAQLARSLMGTNVTPFLANEVAKAIIAAGWGHPDDLTDEQVIEVWNIGYDHRNVAAFVAKIRAALARAFSGGNVTNTDFAADCARLADVVAERDALARYAEQCTACADAVERVADTLAERCKRLEAELENVQWYQPIYNGHPSCPDCTNFYADGHAPDCGLDALLKEKP